MKAVRLLSGNTYYFQEETNSVLAHGFLLSPNNAFKGGYLGKEAIRKYAVFSKLNGVTVLSNVEAQLEDADFNEFAEKLGTISNIFKSTFFKFVNDLDDANGTSSKAQSCDDRQRYYRTVGIDEAFKTSKGFMLGLFIANHVSIFGVENFRTTFFKGKDEPVKDDELDSSSIFMKNVYADCGFKAPAAYIRALCQG
jgi:hypothetical protein